MRISRNYTIVFALFVASACMLAGSAGARPQVAPTITAYAPNHGPTGQRIVIYGHNFTSPTVWFGTVEATEVTVDANATHLYVKVPGDLGDTWVGQIKVTTMGGEVSTGTFRVHPELGGKIARPHIFNFAPMKGTAGTKVRINGSNFGGAQWVKFGGVKALYTVPKLNLIIATVPKNAHTGRIMIKTNTGTTTLARGFTVLGGI
jgi:hypothetical protein